MSKKTEVRELRDLLETTQAEVKRLKAELAARESAGYAAAQQAMEEELQALRVRVQELVKETELLRAGHETAAGEHVAALERELASARRAASEASVEVKKLREQMTKLQEQLKDTAKELEKTKARLQQRSKAAGDEGSFWGRVREVFSRSHKKELLRANKEISRLKQQLSLAQLHLRRRG